MDVLITFPVYNEAETLEKSIRSTIEFLKKMHITVCRIVVADNASTDNTPAVMERISREFPFVKYVRIPIKGRGVALRTVWKESDCDILTFMDIDLSTSLDAFPCMLREFSQGADIVVGSRLIKGSVVQRGFKREVLSRGYNALIKAFYFTKIHDMQCGFKGVRKEVFMKLEPFIKDNEFFFDTELLLIAEKIGFKIKEIPVDWIDDSGSTVKIGKTVRDYIKNSAELRFRLGKIKVQK